MQSPRPAAPPFAASGMDSSRLHAEHSPRPMAEPPRAQPSLVPSSATWIEPPPPQPSTGFVAVTVVPSHPAVAVTDPPSRADSPGITSPVPLTEPRSQSGLVVSPRQDPQDSTVSWTELHSPLLSARSDRYGSPMPQAMRVSEQRCGFCKTEYTGLDCNFCRMCGRPRDS